jgi:hypothetical protein
MRPQARSAFAAFDPCVDAAKGLCRCMIRSRLIERNDQT